MIVVPPLMLARTSVLTGDSWFIAARNDSILVTMRLGLVEDKRHNGHFFLS
jgi:hypothetical protein